MPRRLTRRLEEAAARAKVPFQREVLLGGATDAGSIALAGAGTLTGCVSIPSRHIHSAVGVVHLGDMEQCVDLLLAFAELLPLEYPELRPRCERAGAALRTRGRC